MREKSESQPANRYAQQGSGEGELVLTLFTEKHYSVSELARLWGLSPKTIRRLFSEEPGVVEIGTEESRSRRVYKTRRIPESVVQRVHRRLRKPA